MAKKDPGGVFSSGIYIPDPSPRTLTYKDLAEFSLLGSENDAREGGVNPFASEIQNDMSSTGRYDPERGPTPWYETGRLSFGDGNGRMTAWKNLASAFPETWGKLRVVVNMYPVLTPEQRQELRNRQERSTAVARKQDYILASEMTWRQYPGDGLLQHVIRVGLAKVLRHVPGAIRADVLAQVTETVNGAVRFKVGLKDSDVWGKGNGGDKQTAAQQGKAAAAAHPRARKHYYDQWSPDPLLKSHSLTYLELVQTVHEWTDNPSAKEIAGGALVGDRIRRPDLDSPPASFEDLAAKFPESRLVAGVLGKRILVAKAKRTGKEENGRMDNEEVQSNIATFGAAGKDGPILLNRVLGTLGYKGVDSVADIEALFRAIEILGTSNLDTPEGIAQSKAAQAIRLAAINRIMARAIREGEERRAALAPPKV